MDTSIPFERPSLLLMKCLPESSGDDDRAQKALWGYVFLRGRNSKEASYRI